MKLDLFDKLLIVVVIVCFTIVSKVILDIKKDKTELESLRTENATLQEAIKHPATTQEPTVKYITKTKFIPNEIPPEKEQDYVNKIKELLNKEQDYKKTIQDLYAMFYIGDKTQIVEITGGKTSKPEIPFLNRPENPVNTIPDYKLSLLAEYDTGNTIGIGLGYNYKRFTIGAKGDNKNNIGIFGLWRFWR